MKAILLVRVSTKTQDFDEQEREVYNMAIKDGYKPEDIIPICEKESGRKLAEEERAGLNRMKELIESDKSINCVYCWEVSRIARRKKINFSVLDYLTEHKIQLIIKEPSIKLFKSNGEIDDGAETVFTLFSQLAESEMRTKLARWKRTKDAKRKESYYTGGWLAYGYKVEDGKIVPDEVTSKVVLKAYSLYLTGKYSYGTLADYFLETGDFNYTKATARRTLANILTNEAYAGIPSSVNKRNHLKTEGNIYPPLVTLDMINRCKEIAKANTTAPKKKYTIPYYGKGLLRCPKCGKMMVAKKNNNTYHCQNCNDGFWIQANLVDSVLWYNAVTLYAYRMKHNNQVEKVELAKQLKDLDTKIAASEKKIKDLESRIELIEHRAYVDGTLATNKADSFIAELNAKIKIEDTNIGKWYEEKTTKEQMLVEMTSDKGYNVETIASIKDEDTRNKIIHDSFDCVFIDRIEKYSYSISMYPKFLKIPIRFILDTKHNKVYNEVGEEEMQGCYEERFKIVRDKEKSRAYNVKYCQEHKEENARRQREYRARKRAEKLAELEKKEALDSSKIF